MSLTSIFAKTPPRMGKVDKSDDGGKWVTFDAVIEDALEFSVDYTQFPIEIGADATDHGIIRPATQVMTISISNNPLSENFLTDAASSLSGLVESDDVVQTWDYGPFAGFLKDTEEMRAKSALEFFVALMNSRIVFDVDSVDFISINMVITKLRRTRNVGNESGLILIVEMQELALLSTTISNNQPKTDQLNEGDASQSQDAAETNNGEVLGVQSTDAETKAFLKDFLLF